MPSTLGPIIHIANEKLFICRLSDGDRSAWIEFQLGELTTPGLFAQRARDLGFSTPECCSSHKAFARAMNPVLEKMQEVYLDMGAVLTINEDNGCDFIGGPVTHDGQLIPELAQAMDNVPGPGAVTRIFQRNVEP